MDDLQSERSNAAAMRLAEGLMSQPRFRDRTVSTDRTIANLFALADTPAGGLTPDSAVRLRGSLSGLEEARRLAADPATPLGPAVNGYTATLKRFMDALALEFAATHAAERDFTTAFIMLARLHERIAIETSIGLTSFSGGEVSASSHRVFLEAVAPQEALIQTFNDLSGPDWSARLSEVLARVDAERLHAAREAVVAVGYGGALDATHRTFWREERLPAYFDLGVFRNRFAQEGISEMLHTVRANNAEVVRAAGLQILLLLIATGATVLGFARLAAPHRTGAAPAPEQAPPLHPAG